MLVRIYLLWYPGRALVRKKGERESCFLESRKRLKVYILLYIFYYKKMSIRDLIIPEPSFFLRATTKNKFQPALPIKSRKINDGSRNY